MESSDARFEGTSRIIWSNFSWQKHSLDKMTQHPIQPNLRYVQCQGIHRFPGKMNHHKSSRK